MPANAKTMKQKADKGYEATDAAMVEDEDDSSGFEDVDSSDEDESETAEDPTTKGITSE